MKAFRSDRGCARARTVCLAALGLLSAAPQLDAALIIPQYNSLPGAHAQLYLDFRGSPDFGKWQTYTVGEVPAYSIDSDTENFSGTELSYIRQIFLRVAEKYSPFNINVTTIDPGNRNEKETAHVMIGGNGAWYGKVVGGVAYSNGFNSSYVPNTAWVFPANLGNGNPKTVAEAAAHEAGHLFGLTHQSTFTQKSDGTWEEQEYSTNNNDPHIRPVMGSSYGSTRGLWWYGTSTARNTYQDDLAILSKTANAFGYRADDHGDTLATATALPLAADGTVALTTGVIERTGDMDLFSFQTGTGEVSFWMDVAEYGAMLDATLHLFDNAGSLLQLSDTSSLAESMLATLTEGNYWIGVAGSGLYGDLGQYRLMGQVVAAVPEPAVVGLLLLAGFAAAARRRRSVA